MNDNRIKIITCSLKNYPFKLLDTNFEREGINEKESTFLNCPVFDISDDRIRGRLPSKVWHINSEIQFLYYSAPHLNQANQEYSSSKMYCFTFELEMGTTYNYPGEARIFMDQVQMGNKTKTIVIFGESEYKHVIFHPLNKEEVLAQAKAVEEKLKSQNEDRIIKPISRIIVP